MPKISLIAKLVAADGKASELEALLPQLINAAGEEGGLEVYSAHASRDEPDVYYFFEVYRDEEALVAHGRGDRMRPIVEKITGCIASSELRFLRPLTAKGLEL